MDRHVALVLWNNLCRSDVGDEEPRLNPLGFVAVGVGVPTYLNPRYSGRAAHEVEEVSEFLRDFADAIDALKREDVW